MFKPHQRQPSARTNTTVTSLIQGLHLKASYIVLYPFKTAPHLPFKCILLLAGSEEALRRFFTAPIYQDALRAAAKHLGKLAEMAASTGKDATYTF